jgi:hypothetical protein
LDGLISWFEYPTNWFTGRLDVVFIKKWRSGGQNYQKLDFYPFRDGKCSKNDS